jgi:multidrug efflux pump subunit AcrA (membrane-fusion protein)
MNESKTTQHQKAQKTGAIALLGSFAACLVFAIILIVLGVKVRHRDAQLADTQKQLAQAKSDGAKAQADLEKAETASADLKTQLDKANAHSADLQSQADQAKSGTADLQTQLDKAKAQTSEVQAQLDKSKSQSADLRNQLSQATAGSTQLLTQLDQAKIQSMDMQQRLQKAEADIAQLQPMLLKTRHMPVTTSFEKERWGHGVTLHVNNLNQQPLSVNITISSQGKNRSQTNVIGAAATLNVDKLVTDDTLDIASDGYETIHLTVQ